MTVSSTTANRTQVTGNGVWDDITINWPMFQNSDSTYAIQVIRTTIATGATTTLAETTDYTVALDGTSPNTGVITLVAGAPSSAYRYTVIPNITKKQEVDLQNAVQVDMPTIEAALDKLTLIVQAQDETLSRAVVLSEDTQITGITLPSFGASDANKLVAINSTGTGMTTVNADELVSVSSFDLSTLTAETTTDTAADYTVIYDASAAAQRKVLLSNLGIGSSAGSGKVKQIVITNVTSTVSVNSQDAWVDLTGLTANITPTSADSRILIGYSINVTLNANNQRSGIRILKGNKPIGISEYPLRVEKVTQYCNEVGTDSGFRTLANNVIDEKAGTTSQLTYKLQIVGDTSATNQYLNRTVTDTDTAVYFRGHSQIFLIEIE